jgi:hypothetical protein
MIEHLTQKKERFVVVGSTTKPIKSLTTTSEYQNQTSFDYDKARDILWNASKNIWKQRSSTQPGDNEEDAINRYLRNNIQSVEIDICVAETTVKCLNMKLVVDDNDSTSSLRLQPPIIRVEQSKN